MVDFVFKILRKLSIMTILLSFAPILLATRSNDFKIMKKKFARQIVDKFFLIRKNVIKIGAKNVSGKKSSHFF